MMVRIFLLIPICLTLLSCVSNASKHEAREKDALGNLSTMSAQCKSDIKSNYPKHWTICHSAGLPENLEDFTKDYLQIKSFLSDSQVYACGFVFDKQEECSNLVISKISTSIPYFAEPFSQSEKNYRILTAKLLAKEITIANFNKLNLQLIASFYKRLDEVKKSELALQKEQDEKETRERNEKITNFLWRLAAASCTLSTHGCSGSSSTSTGSGCSCECVNGQMTPLCSSTLDIPPICTGTCPLAMPGIAPISSPDMPPLGTKTCSNEQVYNSTTYQYEWRKVCY